jgi:RNA polymerase-binding transcription factor DksA
MEHLSKKEIQECKNSLNRILEENSTILKEVEKDIKTLRAANQPIPEELVRKQTKIQGIVSASIKSLEQIENGTFAIDIHNGQQIPFSILKKVPYIKVNNGNATRFTGSTGLRARAYGH